MPWEKQFDESQALERAMQAFWSGGYDGTSMTELLDQMGIQKGSFYATYGSKHEVLIAALDAYTRDRFDQFEKLLQEPSPRAALEKHLRSVATDACGCHRDLGCFVVNMALELAPKDESVRAFAVKTFELHEGLYRQLLEAAKSKGEFPASFQPRAVARGLLSMVIGMRVLARAGVAAAMIESIRDQAIQLLKNGSHQEP